MVQSLAIVFGAINSMTRAEKIEAAKRMRSNGASYPDIACLLGVSWSTANRWCNATVRSNAKTYRYEYNRSLRGRCLKALNISKHSARRHGHQPCSATLEELEAAWSGKCHICGVPDTECLRTLCMDHDHSTGQFRGWACDPCNTGIGKFKDSPTILRAAARYLEQHQPAEDWAQAGSTF